MYGNSMTLSSLTAVPAIGAGLTIGWWAMTIVMAFFLLASLIQLTRRSASEKP